MMAILTKFLGATDFRGARVKAYAENGLSVTVLWDYALNPEENHRAAAQAFAGKYNWCGHWYAGSTKEGWVFVSIAKEADFVIPVRD